MMATMLLSGCFGGKSASSSGRGGEVVGVSGRGFKEPTPYGMTLVKRGSLRMGVEKQDSLWGKSMPVKDISVDGFWMDETEVTNSQYKQFVHWGARLHSPYPTGRPVLRWRRELHDHRG